MPLARTAQILKCFSEHGKARSLVAGPAKVQPAESAQVSGLRWASDCMRFCQLGSLILLWSRGEATNTLLLVFLSLRNRSIWTFRVFSWALQNCKEYFDVACGPFSCQLCRAATSDCFTTGMYAGSVAPGLWAMKAICSLLFCSSRFHVSP